MPAPGAHWVRTPAAPANTHTNTAPAAMWVSRRAPRPALAAVVLLLLRVDVGLRLWLCAGCARAVACGLPGLLGPGRTWMRAVALAWGVCGLCSVL